MGNLEKPIKIQIRTEDKELLTELTAYLSSKEATDFRGSRVILTFDSADWQPVIEAALTFTIEASREITLGLIGAWLYERFKEKPPKAVSVDHRPTAHQQITVVINNYIINQSEVDNQEEQQPGCD